MDQEYATIAEIDLNTSISAARESEEVHELSENPSYTLKTSTQQSHPNALKMEPNESYIPTSTVEVVQNEAYGVNNDGIDVNKNQAYMPVTAAGAHNITLGEVYESAEHSHAQDTDCYERVN